jgi:hypothetical protein
VTLARSGALALALTGSGCVAELMAPDPGPTTPLQPDSPRGEGDPTACDPGEKTLHRLNRAEYDRTVQDLLGVTSTPAPTTFPADDTARGFDNNADVLSTSPLLTEKLADAAFEITRVLFARETVERRRRQQRRRLEPVVDRRAHGLVLDRRRWTLPRRRSRRGAGRRQRTRPHARERRWRRRWHCRCHRSRQPRL